MQNQPIEVPFWVIPSKPDRLALHEAIALLDLEGKWIRMTAPDQRAIMGSPVFGKQEFRVLATGDIEVSRSICFGTDAEQATYSPATVAGALAARKRLSPGMQGKSYFAGLQAA